MIEQPQVHARTDIVLTKQPSQEQFGHCTRGQAQMVIDAASQLGAAIAQEFATDMFAAINCPIDDNEFNWALRVVLDEYNAGDLADRVFSKQESTNGKTQDTKNW